MELEVAMLGNLSLAVGSVCVVWPESVFILTFADFRPMAAKYSDSFLSIIFLTYPKPLSIMTLQLRHYLDIRNALNDSP